MTDIDWDLNLLKDLKPTKTNKEQEENELDLMLQPITTQENFKMSKKMFDNEKSSRKNEEKSEKLITKAQFNKIDNDLNKESQKFRDYLSEKVEELRKSKEIINSFDKNPIQENKLQNKKNSTLRSIINQEESKQKDSEKSKLQTNTKKANDLEINRKSIQNPVSTPPLKPPLFKKANETSVSDKKNTRKSITIDHINSNDANKTNKELHEKERRKTPESKNSFRIKRTSNVNSNHQISAEAQKLPEITTTAKSLNKESPVHQSKNKKLREEFMRLNEEERGLQQEIFNFHKESKSELDNIMKKYQISSSNFEKYGITKEIELEPNILEENKEKASPSKKSIQESKVEQSTEKIKENEEPAISALKKEKLKNQALDEQIEKLNNLLKTKKKEIDKMESKIEKNPYVQFIRELPEDIMEEIDEDETDIVEELPRANTNIDNQKYSGKEFSSTYSSVMSEMKNKKWGLKQRITFETHRESPERKFDQKQSRTDNNFASLEKLSSQKEKNVIQQQEFANLQNENFDNKIEMNSRLKNLLFD